MYKVYAVSLLSWLFLTMPLEAGTQTSLAITATVVEISSLRQVDGDKIETIVTSNPQQMITGEESYFVRNGVHEIYDHDGNLEMVMVDSVGDSLGSEDMLVEQ